MPVLTKKSDHYCLPVNWKGVDFYVFFIKYAN